MNTLQNEKSPYLLQHKNNPVNWYAWGQEAFEKAKEQDKPVFVSIGYSTCHWCHVMAHESFEDAQIAELLNKYFICVKVDREERPDVDNIYMNACQAVNGSGGWPLSAFTDCDKSPFFIGTYYTKNNFSALLSRINDLWQNERKSLKNYSLQIVDYIKNNKNHGRKVSLENSPDKVYRFLEASFDSRYGGFSDAPKFPSPHNLLFLINYYRETKVEKSLYMCEKTLQSMSAGGIFDQVGGGFSRYSTDRYWLVPHFEKMLYDNALLLLAYTECFDIIKNSSYKQTAEKIIEYLLRDMSDGCGAFYAAEDADSEGQEGAFYVFSKSEIENILGNDAENFCLLYNVTAKGNFEGKNILNRINSQESEDGFSDKCLKKLFDFRAMRKRPLRDEKISTANNGLTLAALSTAARVFQNNDYKVAAERIADFIDDKLTDKDGSLISYYSGGAGKYSGFAEDYAFYIYGLLELYKTNGNKKLLMRAISLQRIFDENFSDGSGGYFISGKDEEIVVMRAKELTDGAIPSYNSVAMHNLLTLYNLTEKTEYAASLAKSLKYFSAELSSRPYACVHAVSAVLTLKKFIPEMQFCGDGVCRQPDSIDSLIEMF